MNKMNPELKAKWVAALRSGEYQQATGCLRDKGRGGFCCLGVLCDISPDVWWGLDSNWAHYGDGDDEQSTFSELPEPFRKQAGIRREDEMTLVDKNDGDAMKDIRKHTFPEIADWIEQNL